MGQTVTLEAQLALIEQVDRAPLAYKRRGELATIVGALAGLRLSKEEVDILSERIEAMFEAVLRESPFWESLLDRLHPELRAEGRAEGMSETIRLFLEDRFGTLSEDLLKALEHADQDTLRNIAAHASKESLEQIRAGLGLG